MLRHLVSAAAAVTVVALLPIASASAAPGDLDWYFTPTTGVATTTFGDKGSYTTTDWPMVCDVDGLGGRPATFASGVFTFYAVSGTRRVGFGRADDFPMCGDWNGDGRDTPAVARGKQFFQAGGLTTGGSPVRNFTFGRETDYPLAGDWDNDGRDTIAVARDNTYIAANSNVDGGGGARVSTFGRADDFPVAGRFGGPQAPDTIALHRGNTFFVSLQPVGQTQRADRQLSFGRLDDFPVAGSVAPGKAAQIGVVRIER